MKNIISLITNPCVAILIAFSFLPTSTVQAQGNLNFTINAGISTGGDAILETTGPDLNLGGGLFAEFGALYTFPDQPISVQTTVGLMFDSVTYVEGEASLDTTLLNLTIFYRTAQHHRLGVGVTHHSSISAERTVNGAAATARFNDATGMTLEWDYLYSEGGYVGLRYVDLEYTSSRTGNNYDAGGLQILVGANF